MARLVDIDYVPSLADWKQAYDFVHEVLLLSAEGPKEYEALVLHKRCPAKQCKALAMPEIDAHLC